TAFITGGSSGIGLAIGKQMAQAGANVALFARDRGRLESAKHEILSHRYRNRQQCLTKSMDVTDNQAVRNQLEAAMEILGPPDFLINSAGKSYPASMEDITNDTFDQVVRTNLHGTWNTITTVVPHMKESGGHIVNISSIAGILGLYGFSVYSSAKFGVMGLSESLRNELKPHNIYVSVLCPPDTDTPMFRRENKRKPPETKAISEGAGIMGPESVARTLVRGIRRKKFLIIPGLEGKIIYWMKRFVPGLLARYLDWKVRQVQSKEK
ncbi:MAG TPA: SDR family oxidoreductase, partial [bacterium]|nr:SDR family oxidoreductase [bacterium]